MTISKNSDSAKRPKPPSETEGRPRRQRAASADKVLAGILALAPEEQRADADQAALDEQAQEIRRRYAESQRRVGSAAEEYIAIGQALETAREHLPSDPAFGKWLRDQRFGFRSQWGRICRHAAEHEETVRRLLESQLASNSAINFEETVELGRRLDERAGSPAVDGITRRMAQEELSVKEALRELRKAVKADGPEAQLTLEPAQACVSSAIEWLRSLEEGSADLLATYPPDLDEQDPNEWLPIAVQCLRSTGSAYLVIGNAIHDLRVYSAIVEDRLSLYAWSGQLLDWSYGGSLADDVAPRYPITSAHLLCLWGPSARGIEGVPKREDCSAWSIPWGQPQLLSDRSVPRGLAERVIRHGSAPGDVFIDPFAGGGCFLLPARDLGRSAKGCDTDYELLGRAAESGVEVTGLTT